MTKKYHAQQLENARIEYAKARAKYDAHSEWNAAKQEADSSLQFWGNKLAFFEKIKTELT